MGHGVWKGSFGHSEFSIKQRTVWDPGNRHDGDDENLVPLDGEITMLRKLSTFLALCALCSGCWRHTQIIGEHPRELVGTWKLSIRSSCSEYGLTSDNLILRLDGTFDQHVILKDGRRLDALMQRWRYEPGSDYAHLTLDKRLEFFTPEHFSTRMGEGVSTFEVLLVDVRSEPTILLNPDSDCVYGKVRSE